MGLMQPTHAGWYWDPAGRRGLFRWWDGVAWTRHVTPDRNDPSPAPFQPIPPGTDGLLHAGRIAFPELEAPWRQCPAYPGFATAIGQERAVGRTGRGEYDALIVIGSRPDRFADLDPPAVADALCAEILATFYPAERPTAPPETQSVEVEGADAIRVDVRLDVDDPALTFTREDVLLIVIGTDLLYASLPELDGVPRPDDAVALLRLA
jgi:hypothetical protein